MADRLVKQKNGYKWDGVLYPRVTSVTDCLPKEFLPRWAAKEAAEYAVYNTADWLFRDEEGLIRDPEEAARKIKGAPWRKRDDAARQGTIVHEAVESYLGGKDDEQIINELTTTEVPYFYAALAFFDSFEPQVLGAEKTLLSKKHEYAGTADIIGLYQDQRVVFDLKTSKNVYTSHGAQIAAYCKADFIIGETEESFGGADLGIVVHLKPDETFHAYPFKTEEWWPLFCAAREMHRLKNMKVPEPLRL